MRLNTSRSVRGTSVYCLSPQGASDKAAQLLAQKENASDIVGGASTGAVRKDLESILFDLELTHTIDEDRQLGGIMLAELRRINVVHTPHPLQGGFAVLRARVSLHSGGTGLCHPPGRREEFETG